MEKKPKLARGKGFYIATYGSLAGLLAVAVLIGYYSFGRGGGAEAYDQPAMEVSGQNMGNDFADILQNQPTPNQQTPNQPTQPTPQSQTQPQPDPGTLPNQQPEADPGAAAEYDQLAEAIYQAEVDAIMAEVYDIYTSVYDTYEDFAQDEDTDEFDAQALAESPNFAVFSEDDTLHWPVVGSILMDFSIDRLIFDETLDQWRTNDSISIEANRGDTVRAAADGIVIAADNTREFGQTVVIDHGNGWITTYGQLEEEIFVAVGDVVNRGQIIGNVGSPSHFAYSLGYHVNFRLSNNDGVVNPNTFLAQ